MRKALILIFFCVSLISSAQVDTTYYCDSAYVYTDGQSWGNALIVDVAEPNVAIISRNSIHTNRTGGLLIMAGRDTPDADTGNVDNSIISGNYIEYTGSVATGAHGIMDGYNLFEIKHNKVVRTCYGIVCEGTVNTTHTSLATQYNIITTPRLYGITTEGQQNKRYYNMTLYNGHHIDGYLVHFGVNIEATPYSYSTNAELKNSIIYSEIDTVVVFVGENEKASFDPDYNLYWCKSSYNNEPSFYVQGEASNPLTFAQWQALGYDTHSRVQNPNFIDTINFVPSEPLFYGTNLGSDYATGLDTSYTFTAGSYPDTVSQGSTWQVGAVLYNSDSIYQADHYVAPDGNDDDPGTYAEPWATFVKAKNTAVAGDTVCFRGGIYTPTSYETGHDIFNYDVTAGNGNCGTSGNRIVYMNYPGETPVFDFTEFGPSTSNVGLYMDSVHYVSFYGLTFKNLPKAAPGPNAMTIDAHACSNLHFERIIIQDGGGAAFRYFGGIGEDLGVTTDTTRWINCDAINNVDSVGNHADGWKCDQDKGAYLYFEGCRAFFNSDDGFDISGSALRVFKNNIAFGQGYVEGGNGNGFKTTGTRDSCSYSTLIFINNLSAYNHATDDGGFGFDFPSYKESEDPLDSAYFRPNARLYNNTAYKNDIGFAEVGENALFPFRNSVYRNNISYDALFVQDLTKIDVMILYYYYPESHNTWDYETGGFAFLTTDTVTVTDADFVSFDSTLAVSQMMAARGSDGSLPSFDFMKLAATSDLIDAGTVYGWSEIENIPGIGSIVYSGSAPDIGYSETIAAARRTRPIQKIGGGIGKYHKKIIIQKP